MVCCFGWPFENEQRRHRSFESKFTEKEMDGRTKTTQLRTRQVHKSIANSNTKQIRLSVSRSHLAQILHRKAFGNVFSISPKTPCVFVCFNLFVVFSNQLSRRRSIRNKNTQPHMTCTHTHTHMTQSTQRGIVMNSLGRPSFRRRKSQAILSHTRTTQNHLSDHLQFSEKKKKRKTTKKKKTFKYSFSIRFIIDGSYVESVEFFLLPFFNFVSLLHTLGTI